MFISSMNIVYLIVNKVYFPNDFFLISQATIFITKSAMFISQ